MTNQVIGNYSTPLETKGEFVEIGLPHNEIFSLLSSLQFQVGEEKSGDITEMLNVVPKWNEFHEDTQKMVACVLLLQTFLLPPSVLTKTQCPELS